MRKTTYCNYKPVLIQDEKHIDLHVLYFLSSKMAMKMKMSKRLIALYIMILLLTKCHYPEPNPGPRTPKFSCGACQKAVKTIDQGIVCDNYNTWFHINCENINNSMYNCLAGSDASWCCTNCGMPNFSTSLFESMLIPESTNSFSTLYNSSHIHSPDSPGTLQMASSPKLSK